MDQIQNQEKETSPVMEFNAWLTAVKTQLGRYSDGQKIEAVEHLYKEVFIEMETKVQAAKAATTLAEINFGKLSFKIVK